MTLFVNYANGGLQSPVEPNDEADAVDRENGERLFLTLAFGPLESGNDASKGELLQTSLYKAFCLLWTHYTGDPRRDSICARVFGFCCLMEKTRGALVEQWMTPSPHGPEQIVLHSAVVQAVSSVPLSPHGRMSEKLLIADIYKSWRFGKPETQSPVLPVTGAGSVWPAGKGELAALMRACDWSASALGPVERWPSSLRNYVDLLLACNFPMIILWDTELLQFYNDAYRDIMGVKHPAGLGQPTRDCWPEVWQFNEPVYQKVLRGETFTFEDQLFPITRYGFLEDAYFTLCYSPVRNDEGTVAGVLVTVFETTPRVMAGMGRNGKLRSEQAFDPEKVRNNAEHNVAPSAGSAEDGSLRWPKWNTDASGSFMTSACRLQAVIASAI